VALNNAYALAAIAFTNTPADMVHLLALELSRATDIPAGKFMKILLPYKMAHMMHKKMKIRDELFLALAGFDDYAATTANERSRAGVERVLAILNSLKGILPETMKELSIPKYKLAGIAKAAASRSDKRYSEADCLTVLEHAWEGKAF
jgi:alcohol dehydrogenase class IV